MNEQQLIKRATDIPGLDAMTGGGLPAAGGTLMLGRPAAGKTVLALQILAHAIARGEGGVFVSFEESCAQILRDAASFRWGPSLAEAERFELIDARPQLGAEVSGAFDLEGLLAAVGLCLERRQASWVVFDGVDHLLRRQRNPLDAIDQVQQLSDWCEARGVSLLLTGKLGDADTAPTHLEGVEFMLSTLIVVSTKLVGHRLSRRLRIAKYRGTAHVADEVAMIMDHDGVHLPHGHYAAQVATGRIEASTERLSTGVARLDEVLGGGLYRGSTALISGLPGTAKTTLAASFAASATARGERVLYLSFDEDQEPVVRNLRSVGIDLRGPLDRGLLHFAAREAWSGLVEEHYWALHQALDRLRPQCLVIDPISALLKAPGVDSAFVSIERILDIAHLRGITTVLTSLGTRDDPQGEATLSHTSTLADTWLALDFNVRGGERNRSLSLVKSRGSAHSNQVRELLLSERGIDLADVYEYGTEVLMGTARMQKESEVHAERRRRVLARQQRQRELERRLGQAEAEAAQLRQELALEQQDSVQTEQFDREHERDVLARRSTRTAHSDAPQGDETP